MFVECRDSPGAVASAQPVGARIPAETDEAAARSIRWTACWRVPRASVLTGRHRSLTLRSRSAGRHDNLPIAPHPQRLTGALLPGLSVSRSS